MNKYKIIILLILINDLTACNTINGVGKDMSDLGYFLEDGVSDMKDHIK